VLQFEGTVADCARLKSTLAMVMSEMEYEVISEEVHTDIDGDGCIILESWALGSFVALWNGRNHVDVNMYLYEEDWDLVTEFYENLADVRLKLQLMDVQPRGVGRVVNFESDVEEEEEPAWVKDAGDDDDDEDDEPENTLGEEEKEERDLATADVETCASNL